MESLQIVSFDRATNEEIEHRQKMLGEILEHPPQIQQYDANSISTHLSNLTQNLPKN